MLILTRRPGDAILIQGGIRVVVLACDNRSVRLGIEAPPGIGILREEIVHQIAAENRRANAANAAAWLDLIRPLRKTERKKEAGGEPRPEKLRPPEPADPT